MTSLTKSKELLTRYAKARIPFIAINTIEVPRTLEIYKSIAEEMQDPIYVHSLARGTYELISEKSVGGDKDFYSAIDYINEEMKRRQNLTLLLTDVPDLSVENTDTKQLLSLVTIANENAGAIVVLDNKTVWNQLQRQGMLVKIDMPDEDEMYGVIKAFMDDYRNAITMEWDDSDIREAASILAGVTRIEGENVIAALIAKGEVLKSDIDEVRMAKNRLFSDISGLEKIDVSDNMKDVGGLTGLRNWLDEKKELLKPEKRDMLKKKGLQPPRGILLVGVPGCGKSLSAKSIAANWRLPLYRLDFATVQGSYVGQSEQQLREALQTAENVSPCILWIDEIEKGLSGAGSSNDGGVSTRMVGQFLFWLQECKKQVFVVATANDVSMLPSELLRRGRFDELFFVDLPASEERRDILSLYMRKYLGLNFSGPLADRVVQMTDGFTGADLESTVRDLAYHSISTNENLNVDTIVDAFNNVVPLSQTSPEKIEAIRDWGKERAVPASGKPIGGEAMPVKQGPKTRKVLL